MSRQSLDEFYNGMGERDTVNSHEDTVVATHKSTTVSHDNGCGCPSGHSDSQSWGSGWSVAGAFVIFFIIFFIVWIIIVFASPRHLQKHDCEELDTCKAAFCAFIVAIIILLIIWAIYAFAGGSKSY